MEIISRICRIIVGAAFCSIAVSAVQGGAFFAAMVAVGIGAVLIFWE